MWLQNSITSYLNWELYDEFTYGMTTTKVSSGNIAQ